MHRIDVGLSAGCGNGAPQVILPFPFGSIYLSLRNTDDLSQHQRYDKHLILTLTSRRITP